MKAEYVWAKKPARSEKGSDKIKPILNESTGWLVKQSKAVCVKGCNVYFAFFVACRKD